MALEIVHNPQLNRVTACLDGVPAAWVDFIDRHDIRDFTHTWTEPDYRGQGLAGQVVAAAVDAALAEGKRPIGSCPYVGQYLRYNGFASADV